MKAKTKIRIIQILKITVGVLLLPLFTCVYFADRLILTALFWMETITLKRWFETTTGVVNSFIRVFVVTIIYLIFKGFQYLFYAS
jgi:uncharacterized membrane protein